MSAKQKLSDADIQSFLAQHSEWSLLDGKLSREWAFADFDGAIAFVNRVATVAEKANHHPDIDIRYNKVVLGLISHDAGGITTRDAKMAAQLSAELFSSTNS
jgi:4a-hydroxytetrahydrobiopterin dehydratase